ncbi:MAG: hypothetical protein H0T42_16620 [Deltaproteobacteria bacterium]|nr:hypothetical protein [Deltaproteobacteria bacterium]
MNDGALWYIGINGQQQGPIGRLAGRMLAAAVASGFGRGGDEASAIGGLGLGS